MRLVAVVAVAVLAVAAACGPAPSTMPVPTPEISCSESHFDPPPTLTCAGAIAAATTVLPFFHPRITRIEFDWGGWCPTWARCAFNGTTDRGHVIFRFVSGDPLLVNVAIDELTGATSVIDSEPLPSGG